MLTLVGVAMSVIVAGMSNRVANIHERQPVDTLLLKLRQAHDLALMKQRNVKIIFNPQTLCYQIEQASECCFPVGYSLVTSSVTTISGQRPIIVFNADGSSSGGNIKITTPVREVRIDVSWLTGRATLVLL